VFVFELLFDASVEEEGDVSVLFGFWRKNCRVSDGILAYIQEARLTRNVALLDALLGEPFRQDIGHTGRRESDREGELGVVPGHGGDVLIENAIG
jgi:hypothetical protein